jgi:hypothetical protein
MSLMSPKYLKYLKYHLHLKDQMNRMFLKNHLFLKSLMSPNFLKNRMNH